LTPVSDRCIIVPPIRDDNHSSKAAGAMIEIRRITTRDPFYEQECSLREDVLLAPIGFDMARFREEYAGVEEGAEHYVAILDHPKGPRVVGCALLLIDEADPSLGKLVQMAIDRQRQGEGIGRRLLATIESRAFGELGLDQLFCHAQTTAIGFYEALGWATDSDEFHEAGIVHRRMILRA